MNKNLHLCICLTDSYKNIYENIFLPTLNKYCGEFENIEILNINDVDSSPGNTTDNNFRQINYKKLHFIYEQILKHFGENIIFLDLDIVFFKKFKDEINDMLETYDMVLQENDNWLNVGVWAISCNQKVKEFFEKDLLPLSNTLLSPIGQYTHNLFKEESGFGSDQDVVNVAIQKTKDIEVGRLPVKYYSNHLRDYKFPDNIPKDCVLFHATNCGFGQHSKSQLMLKAFQEIYKKNKND